MTAYPRTLLGHQPVGADSGFHRFRWSMSRPMINTVVARRSAAWRCRFVRSVLRRSWP